MGTENVTKQEWVAMFEEAGLSEEMMGSWHRVFERDHPEAHQRFLEHLGIGAEEIDEIRDRYGRRAG